MAHPWHFSKSDFCCMKFFDVLFSVTQLSVLYKSVGIPWHKMLTFFFPPLFTLLFHIFLGVSGKGKNMRFEIFMTVKIHVMIYWIMWHHVLWYVVITVSEEHIASIIRIDMEEHVPPECWWPPTRPVLWSKWTQYEGMSSLCVINLVGTLFFLTYCELLMSSLIFHNSIGWFMGRKPCMLSKTYLLMEW